MYIKGSWIFFSDEPKCIYLKFEHWGRVLDSSGVIWCIDLPWAFTNWCTVVSSQSFGDLVHNLHGVTQKVLIHIINTFQVNIGASLFSGPVGDTTDRQEIFLSIQLPTIMVYQLCQDSIKLSCWKAVREEGGFPLGNYKMVQLKWVSIPRAWGWMTTDSSS